MAAASAEVVGARSEHTQRVGSDADADQSGYQRQVGRQNYPQPGCAAHCSSVVGSRVRQPTWFLGEGAHISRPPTPADAGWCLAPLGTDRSLCATDQLANHDERPSVVHNTD